MVIRMRGGRLDSEHVDVQMGSNLIAHADTVSKQIKERKDLPRKKKSYTHLGLCFHKAHHHPHTSE